jgi:hypothetical protein
MNARPGAPTGTPTAKTPRTPLSPTTVRLLLLGSLAGPIYTLAGAAQYVFRDGLDITRHALSMASLGTYGWTQVATFIGCGILVLMAGVGLAKALESAWGGRLLAVHGIGIVAAGFFRVDPALGFPPGSPEEAATMSWHGMAHFMVGGIGFVCFIAATLVIGRLFARAGERPWALFSRVTGVLFLAAFVGIASGSTGPATVAFVAAVVLSWVWLTAVCVKVARSRPE